MLNSDNNPKIIVVSKLANPFKAWVVPNNSPLSFSFANCETIPSITPGKSDKVKQSIVSTIYNIIIEFPTILYANSP